MKKIFKENLRKITALLLVASMTMSFNTSVFAQEDIMQDVDELIEEEVLVEEIPDGAKEDGAGSISESDEKARERECMPASPDYLKKFLTYLSLKYPEIGIDPQYGTGTNPNIADHTDDLYNWYNATKMKRQKVYDTIEIDGEDTFKDYPELTKNMVQFRYLGCFGDIIGADDNGETVYSDTVKTLIIRNVDEIRNLYVPASVETLIIENTTLNCYYWENDSPGFQCGILPGDLEHCKNLKKLVLKNVKFGDNYKHPELEDGTWGSCGYEKNYVLNLQNCHNLEELEIDVSFEGALETQLAIDGGTDNLFEKLTDDKCKINPAPGIGYGQVYLYANENSYLAKRYNSSETVTFKNGQFRVWLIEALGIDTNHDGVISQAELDAIETLTINDRTAHAAKQTSLSSFSELADIGQMHGLKTLELDFYDPSSSYSSNGNRQPLKGIDFPDSLENLCMKNIYWEKDTQTKSHDNADIILTNLKRLELYNTEVKVAPGDSYFNHSTQIVLTDSEGALESCIIERTDVESIQLINNSEGKKIQTNDEKKRIRFSAAECPKLTSIEFLGEGYAVEGSLDLTNDIELTHIGIPNSDKSQWIIYGEFYMTYAPVNIVLNGCSKLGTECKEIVIDYDFVNGRSLYVQAMNTNFDDSHKLSIKRQPRLAEDKAGDIYLSCDTGKWIYNTYNGEPGFTIEERSSLPTIAVFSAGQRIRTSGEGNHNSDSKYTEDSDRWVERWNMVLAPGGYSNNFGNLSFYVVDKVVDEAGQSRESLRRVFYGSEDEPVYVEWDKQNEVDTIITLPIQKVGDEYILTGSKLSSTGTPGEVELKLYIYNTEGGNKVKSYIGYQNIKIFSMPDSVDLVNDGTQRGSGTVDDPFIVDKGEELKLKARLLVNDGVDRSGDFALRDVYWRIKEYDDPRKYTSDSDGYSLYTLDTATKAGISVVREELAPGETEAQYDRRTDNTGDEPTYYNHRRFSFDTDGSKFKVVAQMPYKNNDVVITKEVFVEYHSKLLSIDVSNDIIYGKKDCEESSITINDVYNTNSVKVNIKNPELYDDCFIVNRDSLSTDGKDIWKLSINNSDITKVKNVISSNNGIITLVIEADGKKYEETIKLSVVDLEASIDVSNDIIYGKKGYDEAAITINNVFDVNSVKVNIKNSELYDDCFIVNRDSSSTEGKEIWKLRINSSDIVKVKNIITSNNGSITLVIEADDKKYEKTVNLSSVYPEASVDVSNDIIHGKKDYEETSITINDVYNINSVKVNIKNPELYGDCFIVNRNTSSIDGKEIWKLKINSSDVAKVKNIIDSNNGSITLAIEADGKKFEKTVALSSLYFNAGKFWCLEIEDQIYTGKAVKPKLNIYYGDLLLEEGKDYTLSYRNNVNAASKTAVNAKGKHIGPSVTIKGKGDYSDKQVCYFSIKPCSIETIAKVEDITVAKTGRDIKIKPTVVIDGKKLKMGKDYAVSTTKDEGDAIATLKEAKEYSLYIVGKGNYEKAIPFKFTITTSIPASKVKIQKIANQNYNNGAEVRPDINIKYGGKNVTDCFDIIYENNKDIGTATVILKAKKTSTGEDFKGEAGYSFAGSKKITFKIVGIK